MSVLLCIILQQQECDYRSGRICFPLSKIDEELSNLEDKKYSLKLFTYKVLCSVNTVMMDSAKSMPDLSIGQSQSIRNETATTYMPTAGEGKKKKGFFSIFKKDKKFNVVNIELLFFRTTYTC